MDFMKIFESLDDLLYEVMSWAVFYPVTLWRTVTQPLTMMAYADSELDDAQQDQYVDTLSPPLFLLLTLLLAHGLELALIGDSPIVSSKARLSVLIHDDTNLLALRMVAFAVFPLIFAVSLVRKKAAPLDRATLRQPFYAQAYVTAPFALAMSCATIFVRLGAWPAIAGLAVIAGGIAWYLWLQTLWFAAQLQTSKWRTFGHALAAYLGAMATFVLVGALFI